VVDELRLVIDSLDQSGANLSNAFAAYRTRIEPRLSAMGIQSFWTNELPLEAATRDPGVVVNALRVLQEAITNVIKYAHTARLDVSCRLTRELPKRIVLSVRDYGRGMVREAPAGHGIANMQSRAHAAGAKLSLASCEPGTLLTLELP
jgi:signal transduction histidine kinase